MHVVLALVAVCFLANFASAETTVTFQQGVNGYSSLLDVLVSPIFNSGNGNVLGSSTSTQFVDGLYYKDTGQNDPEKQYLLRFDNIIGNGVGKIPAGATITGAKLTLVAGVSPGAQSKGPYGLAQMLTSFNSTTSWNSLNAVGTGDPSGAMWNNGITARPVDNGFGGYLAKSEKTAVQHSADMTRIVQNWANGVTNNGIAMTAGTADGFQIVTSGVSNPAYSPLLEVTFDTTPQPAKTVVSLQQGVGGYTGTTMSRIDEDDTNEDGAILDEMGIDGAPFFGLPVPYEEVSTLIKFDDIFVSSGGVVPDGATILDAQLVITTARSDYYPAVGTNGNYAAYQMLTDWNLSTVYTDFNGDGPSENDGEIGPVLDLTGAMVAGAEATLDVTSAIVAWQSGASNYGFNVQSYDTTDGWTISWTGATNPLDRPELLITYTMDPGFSSFDAVPEPCSVLLVALLGYGLSTTRIRRVAATKKSIARGGCFLLAFFVVCLSTNSVQAETTVTFQEGVNGYSFLLDLFISPDFGEGGTDNVLGDSIESYPLDGLYYKDTGQTESEKQYLLRFDRIFGNGASQIPVGATITNAQLTLVTGTVSGADSNGPFGVGQMLTSFNGATSWANLNAAGTGGPSGAKWNNGVTARPLDNAFRGYLHQGGTEAVPELADITRIVRNWANGAANLGVAVTAGTTDAWQVVTSGVANPIYSPKLEVTYDISPQPAKTIVSLQQGVAGYNETTMSRIDQNDTVQNGSLLDQAFIDGAPVITTTTDEDSALIKFDNIFTSSGGLVPDDAIILDAQLVITTAQPDFSLDAGTNGDYAAYQMLVDWNHGSKFSDFNGDGPSQNDGEIGSPLDATGAMVANTEATLDVTSAVTAWQEGAPNYGLSLQSLTTTDDWGIYWTGAQDPLNAPELLITYTARNDADYDADGDVDLDDYFLWSQQYGMSGDLAADGNHDGAVDAADYTVWRDNFETSSIASAIPEPTALTLLFAMVGTAHFRSFLWCG